MSGWTKLYSSLVTSSIWIADDATLRVWIAMLATADADGLVEGSVPGFANLARVTVDQMRAALVTLTSPDADSRTPDHEGRRVEAFSGGWRILNYQLYRDRPQSKDGSKAPAMRAYRARRAVTHGNALPTPVTVSNDPPTRYPEERGEKQEVRREKRRSGEERTLAEGSREYPAFDAFWAAYPRKVAKKAAWAAWAKVNPSETLAADMVTAIRQQTPGWTDPKFIPHPATWIRAQRWMDELPSLPELTHGLTPKTAGNEAALRRFLERHADDDEVTA